MTTKIPFPVQIGLVGAPGSGKQAVAEKFTELATSWFAQNASELRVLANAGNVIESEYDAAMGLYGSWMDDFRAYYLRFEAEERARQDGASFLSLGTVVDNIAHCGVNLENIMVGLTTPDQQQRIQQQQVAMTALTFLFLNNFRYLFGFYIPHPGATVILPGQDEGESNYNQRVDNAIRQIFGNFGLRIQVLDQPTVDEKAQAMFDTVKDIVENGVPEPEPQTDEVPPSADDTLPE